jgi:sulfonate transport system substrate-binding protein
VNMSKSRIRLGRRALMAGIPVVLATSVARSEAKRQLRIGYQRNGILVIAKQQKLIEARVQPLGVTVSWVEFSFGPPMLEALRFGSLDFGTVGDTPPIFAQAARSDLVYVAAQPAGGSSSAILLPAGSNLQTLADLKGKRVAFARGSSAHNLTVAALEKVGLSFADIQPIQLAPVDAAAAFSGGNIDAWTIWDPYYAVAETKPGVRVLATAKEITEQNSFYLSSLTYAQEHPDILTIVIDELTKVAAWSNGRRGEVATLLAEGTGVPLDAMQRAVGRSIYQVSPMTDELVSQQQHVADRFFRLGLIPARIRVADIVWRPQSSRPV